MSETTTRKRRARKPLTESERAERRERDRKRLEEAAKALQSSEGWQRWITLRKQNGLRRYSCNNLMLLALDGWARQMPELSYVAGYRWWASHGYQVIKGSKALSVLAPIARKLEDESGEERRRVVGFQAVAVFDRCQVEATEAAVALGPEQPEPISGASHAAALPQLEALAAELGVTVSYEEAMPGAAQGFYRHTDKTIALRKGAPNAIVRTFLHELAHAIVSARQDEDDPATRLSYAEEECVVECAGSVAAASIGLDTSAEAVPYVAGWGEADELAAVSRAAELIDAIARTLEKAIAGSEDPA